MKNLNILLTTIIFFLVTGNSFAITEVKKWEPYEIRFVAKNTYENPYVDAMPYNGEALLRVKFTGTSGDCDWDELRGGGFLGWQLGGQKYFQDKICTTRHRSMEV